PAVRPALVKASGGGHHARRDVEAAVRALESRPPQVVGERAVAAAIVVDGRSPLAGTQLQELVEAQGLRFGRVPVRAGRSGAVGLELPGVVALDAGQDLGELHSAGQRKLSMYFVASGPSLKMRSRMLTACSKGGWS